LGRVDWLDGWGRVGRLDKVDGLDRLDRLYWCERMERLDRLDKLDSGFYWLDRLGPSVNGIGRRHIRLDLVRVD
jgi:hypothetical protein